MHQKYLATIILSFAIIILCIGAIFYVSSRKISNNSNNITVLKNQADYSKNLETEIKTIQGIKFVSVNLDLIDNNTISIFISVKVEKNGLTAEKLEEYIRASAMRHFVNTANKAVSIFISEG